MKSKLIPFLSAAVLLLVVTFSVASAEGVDSGNANANVKKVNAQTELNERNSDNRDENATTTRGNATSTAAVERNRGNATSTNSNSNGQRTAEAHRSAVSSFVQSLLDVADREGGIGTQVRVIAQAQQDSATTTASAIERVESRNALKTFLIGSDYKNLGVLRSEMVKMQNNLNQLKTLLGSTTDSTDQATIDAQIQALEQEQTNIRSFITAREKSFSLFGWFSKLFAK